MHFKKCILQIPKEIWLGMSAINFNQFRIVPFFIPPYITEFLASAQFWKLQSHCKLYQSLGLHN